VFRDIARTAPDHAEKTPDSKQPNQPEAHPVSYGATVWSFVFKF